MRKTVIWMVVLVLILLVLWIGYRVSVNLIRMRKGQTVATQQVTGVEVATASRASVEDKIQATGTLAAMAQVMVYSKVPGKLIRNLVAMNQYVKQDEVLALVDRDEPGFEFTQSEVKSPMAGVVSKTFLDMGAMVSPQTPIVQVVSTGRVKAVVNVVERDIGKVRRGQPAVIRVDAYDQDFPGTVTNISPVENPQSRSVEVEIMVPNPGGKLKPGMYARSEIRAGKHDGLVIPAVAVTRREDKSYVMVVGSDAAHEREVTLGQDLGERVEITSGLKESEQVVTAGAYGLKDGDKVVVKASGQNPEGSK
jgi:membrane fusion protein, multidrug efflux system